MKEKTYCPALGKEVVVSLKGWDHISKGTRTKRRNTRDKINRFSLLKAAKYVISKSPKGKTEKRDGQNYYILEGNGVRVVLKLYRDKKYYFHSVYKTK